MTLAVDSRSLAAGRSLINDCLFCDRSYKNVAPCYLVNSYKCLIGMFCFSSQDRRDTKSCRLIDKHQHFLKKVMPEFPG